MSSSNQPSEDVNGSDELNVNKDSVDHASKTPDVGPYEDVDDPLVTIQDVLDVDKYNKETARCLLGGQDSSVCTYPEGYKPRQPLFACLTCTPPPNGRGVCYGCSVHCHEGHTVVELYTKRRFRCDCGNEKFGQKCTLFEEKEPFNSFNTYNDNFAGVFCICKKLLPDEVDEPMLQCAVCEDWFHLSHLDEKFNIARDIDEVTDSQSLVCTNCSYELPFLASLEVTNEVICFSSSNQSGNTTLRSRNGPLFLADGWRKNMCKCAECMSFYEQFKCEFLLDDEDDIEAYERANIESTKDEKEPDDQEMVDTLVKEAGRDAAINVLRGFHDLKTKLTEFIRNKTEEGVNVITTEHVNSFFQQIKRPRLDKHNFADDF